MEREPLEKLHAERRTDSSGLFGLISLSATKLLFS
jgi:hypothetical protein